MPEFYRKLLTPLWKAWLKLGHILGVINTTLLLTVFYFIIITPVGLLRKVMGKDTFGKVKEHEGSLWQSKSIAEPDLSRYLRQF